MLFQCSSYAAGVNLLKLHVHYYTTWKIFRTLKCLSHFRQISDSLLTGGRTGGPLAQFTNEKKWSRITDINTSFSRITKDTLFILWILMTCSYTRKSVWRKQTRKWLRVKAPILQVVYLSHSRQTTLTIRRTRVSNSSWIEWPTTRVGCKITIQVLYGSRKAFRSRVMKDNFLNSRFKENTHHENTPVRLSWNIMLQQVILRIKEELIRITLKQQLWKPDQVNWSQYPAQLQFALKINKEFWRYFLNA